MRDAHMPGLRCHWCEFRKKTPAFLQAPPRRSSQSFFAAVLLPRLHETGK
jgi:hypothetical protein